MTPRPASTVVLVRERSYTQDARASRTDQAPVGLETLLLLRNSALAFEGGAWVFPGGKVDVTDYTEGDATLVAPPHHRAAINAGIRETREEAGLLIEADRLIPIAHWTTPLGLPRRYATWFFLCPLHEDVNIVVDAEEILDYRWQSPAAALQEHREGRIRLPVPTAHTLNSLLPFASLTQLCQAMKSASIHVFPENSEHYQPLK